MKLLGSNKSKITKNKNGELVLVHYNIINNNYQRDSRILYTFAPNKRFVRLLEISPRNYIFLKTLNSEFHKITSMVYRSKPLEVEDKINLTMIIK